MKVREVKLLLEYSFHIGTVVEFVFFFCVLSHNNHFPLRLNNNLVILLLDDNSVMALFVPETSYSSSEGEDDFYDAFDDPFSSHGNSPTR